MTGYKIHIIDDDPTTHEILGEYLTLAGYTVSSAYDGRAGLELMRNDPPDLVLLDIQMPHIDGFGLLKAVGDEGIFADVPILIITSLQRTNLKIKGLELGADDFIIKPFERAELFARIKAALRRSSRYRDTAGKMSGNLADISVAELLQTLEINKKQAHVVFADMDGELYVNDGQILYARQAGFDGKAALCRLLLLNSGSFMVNFGVAAPGQLDGSAIQRQLLDCFVEIDTVNEILAASGENNPLINDISSVGDFSGKKQLQEQLPLPAYRVLAAMPGDLTANARALAPEHNVNNQHV